MKLMRRAYRILLLLTHLLVGLTLAMTYLRNIAQSPPAPQQQKAISWWLKRTGTILKLRLHIRGILPDTGGILIVSNHISWLDILVIASALPVSFVSKVEVQFWPLLGKLAERAGTLFIQRGGKNAANQATEQMTWYLLRGQTVAFFPEGTTTDGRDLRRFHSRLFGAAIHASSPVQPLALHYPHAEGINPVVPFIGDHPIIKHGWKVLGEKVIEAEIIVCNPIQAKQFDRKTLAKKAHNAVNRALVPRQTQLPQNGHNLT